MGAFSIGHCWIVGPPQKRPTHREVPKRAKYWYVTFLVLAVRLESQCQRYASRTHGR